MRLAILTNILTPYRIPLFEEFARDVQIIVLLMTHRLEQHRWELEETSFPVVALPGLLWRSGLAQFSRPLNFDVLRRLRRFDPDVILSGGFAPANMAAALYCRACRSRLFPWGEVTRRDATGRSAAHTLWRRFIVNSGTGCIASSTEAKDAFASYGMAPENVLLAPMPIDVDYFHERTARARLTPKSSARRARHSGPIILFIGRITDAKGYQELTEIYRIVLDRMPGATLIIVGDGPHRNRWQEIVRGNRWHQVHFTGWLQASELIEYFAIADLFVFPTLFDTFGAVTIEAMAAGVPVAASVYASSTHDFVEDGVTGLRIDPRDYQGSAEALIRIAEWDSATRAAVIAEAYRRVKRCDTPSTAAAMLEFMTSFRGGCGAKCNRG